MHSLNSLTVAVVVLFAAGAAPAMAATRTLACGGTKTITGEAARLNPGDVLQVSGTCVENVSIPAHVHSITIEGLPGARVQAAVADAVVRIRGRAIRVRGFVITGGTAGVEVNDGGFAWIDGNIVEANSNGVLVQFNSQARVWNNQIQNNSGDGIQVSRSASALIGVSSLSDLTASPNSIVGNAGTGITVRAAHATIWGNTISGNGSHGVFMLRAGQADIASNTIATNNGQGIEISNNSSVSLGTAAGTGLSGSANSGSGNAAFGVRCTSGFVAGRIGTLSGVLGALDVATCINAVTP